MFIKIAIDGPGGVGKSTVAKLLAKKLNLTYINTGLIFRGLAFYLNKYPNHPIEESLTRITKYKHFIFKQNKWFLNEIEIREEELINKATTEKATEIAKLPEVRNYVREIELREAEENNIVMEGRDIGTKILPDALLKIFLNTNSKIRAERRYKELKEKGFQEETIDKVLSEIEERDKEDSLRTESPLIKAKDAIEIDASRSLETVVKEIETLVKKKVAELNQNLEEPSEV